MYCVCVEINISFSPVCVHGGSLGYTFYDARVFFLNRFGVSCKFDFGGAIMQFVQILALSSLNARNDESICSLQSLMLWKPRSNKNVKLLDHLVQFEPTNAPSFIKVTILQHTIFDMFWVSSLAHHQGAHSCTEQYHGTQNTSCLNYCFQCTALSTTQILRSEEFVAVACRNH